MKLKRVSQGSRVEVVVARLRELIEKGKLEPGERIPSEPELALQLGVSRPVLREAIGRLKSVGLLDVRHGSGTFVGNCERLPASAELLRSVLAFSPRDLRTVAEFRRGLEQEAARRAAIKATPEQLRELRQLCSEMDQFEVNSLESMRADFKFHLKIVDIGGNALMSNILGVLYEFVLGGMVQTIRTQELGPRGTGHAAILKAIESRDPLTAEAAMRAHMDLLEKRLIEAEQEKLEP